MILTVTEAVSSQDVPLLKAGLNKIFKSGRKRILLDLLGVETGEVGANSDRFWQAIAQIPTFAEKEFRAQLSIVLLKPWEGQFKAREEALKKLQSPLADLLEREARLHDEVDELKREEYKLNAEIAKSAGSESVKSAQKLNSVLRESVKSIEEELNLILNTRSSPFKTEGLAKKNENLVNVLAALLAREGVLQST